MAMRNQSKRGLESLERRMETMDFSPEEKDALRAEWMRRQQENLTWRRRVLWPAQILVGVLLGALLLLSTETPGLETLVIVSLCAAVCLFLAGYYSRKQAAG
jgi:uncharacterized membrane protein YfcA